MFNYSELEQVAARYEERLRKAEAEHRARRATSPKPDCPRCGRKSGPSGSWAFRSTCVALAVAARADRKTYTQDRTRPEPIGDRALFGAFKRRNQAVHVFTAQSQARRQEDNMSHATPTPSTILEGIPRAGYDVHVCPFPGSLFACLTYLGDPCDYDTIMGVSGAAFRRLWNRDDGGNIDLSYLGDEPFRRIFQAIGYDIAPSPPRKTR